MGSNKKKADNCPETEKKSFIENQTLKYFLQPTKNQAIITDDFQILNNTEAELIWKIKIHAVLFAAIIGVAGVVFLALPIWLFPDLFPDVTFSIPLINKTIDFPAVTTIYGLFLVIIEIYGLTILNVKTVKKIANACGFPDHSDPHYAEDLDALIRVALDKKDKSTITFGIDPYLELSPIKRVLFYILIKSKAALSNFLFKLIIKRVLGRFALRLFMDLAGIPVYAFWNGWASYTLIKEAKARIIAPQMSRRFAKLLHQNYGNNKMFIEIIPAILQYISILKRSFHYNHYVLTNSLYNYFEINIKQPFFETKNLYSEIEKLDKTAIHAFEMLFIYGIIVDGKLSLNEKKAITKMHEKGYISFTIKQIEDWQKSFSAGKGLSAFYNIYNPVAVR